MRQTLVVLAALSLAGLPLTGCHRSPLPPNVIPPRAPAKLTAGALPATLPAAARSIVRTPDTPAARGRRFAETHCTACHAIGELGSSPNPAAKPFRDIVKVYPPEQLQEAFAEGIVVGHPRMPPFTLSPEEADDLIAYLRTLER